MDHHANQMEQQLPAESFRFRMGTHQEPGRSFSMDTEKILQVVVAPLGWRGGPCTFQAAADRVDALAAAELVVPTETLLFNVGALRLGTNMLRLNGGTVGLAEGVATGDQRDGLFIVHRHTREGLADVARRSDRIGLSVRPFRVHIDQAHLHRTEMTCKLAIAAVPLIAQPLTLRPPVDVLFWFP